QGRVGGVPRQEIDEGGQRRAIDVAAEVLLEPLRDQAARVLRAEQEGEAGGVAGGAGLQGVAPVGQFGRGRLPAEHVAVQHDRPGVEVDRVHRAAGGQMDVEAEVMAADGDRPRDRVRQPGGGDRDLVRARGQLDAVAARVEGRVVGDDLRRLGGRGAGDGHLHGGAADAFADVVGAVVVAVAEDDAGQVRPRVRRGGGVDGVVVVQGAVALEDADAGQVLVLEEGVYGQQVLA